MRLGHKTQPSTSVGFELGIFVFGAEMLTHCAYFNFSKQLKLQSMHPRSYFGNGHLERRLPKILGKFNIFYGICYEKQKDPRTNFQSLFRLPNLFKNFCFVVYHLTIFDALIQSGFEFFPKITIVNLCKPFHNAIIILFTFSSETITLWARRRKMSKM